MDKKIIFSGVQPSGNLHLGNYLGAIKQWVELQNDYNCIFCVVDYHAITVPQDPKILREKIIEIAKIYLAAGIDPEKAVIFQQSAIKEHAELAWILNCTGARMSDLENMTQYKDKAAKQENSSVGLFDYPVLMAADILLYNTDLVPVGEDQVQHVELTRDLAKRFNFQFGDTFKVPEYKIRKEGARIMGLDDPTKKMSKSAKSEYNYIALVDKPEDAEKKIMKATTDSEGIVKYDTENKPGVSNLLAIHSLLSGKSIADLESEFSGQGYGNFKKAVAEEVKSFLTKFQEKYYNISNEKVEEILRKGSSSVKDIAEKKIREVKNKLGIF